MFTEKNSDNGQTERFVYVQQGEAFEKRNVKVGVSDYFFAEIQEGLAEGEVVSLELPKEEREKKAHPLAGKRPGRSETAGPKLVAGSLGGSSTNAATATGPASSETSTKGPAPSRSGPRESGSSR